MKAWRVLSIRARLAVAYAAAMGLVLLAYAVFVAAFVHDRLNAEIAHRLDQEVEIAERSLTVDDAGRLVWHAPHDNHEAYQPLRNVSWLDIHRPDGSLIYRVPEIGVPEMADVIPSFEARTSGFFSLVAPNGAHLRVLQRDIEIAGQKVVARAALSEDQAEHDLATLFWVMGLSLPLAIALSGLGGYLMAGRALSPIAKMTAQARVINAERLDARLPVDNPGDELGRLATTFNDLFAHLEQSFEQLQRFTADASHELRTPLAVIRSVGEVGLGKHHDEAAYRDIVGTMLEEADRLTLLVESLLTLTRADAGRMALILRSVDLGALAGEVAAHLKVLAEEKNQILIMEPSEPVLVSADIAILRQAVVNILDNAIKYTPSGGQVTLRVARTGSEVTLEIADSGPGIPPEHHGKVFDRFYRVDAARNRAEGGFGLGLAIARQAVEIHGGRIEIAGSPDKGSVFRIVLPLLAPHET
ncbi:MAG: hypothetical protein A3E23_12125 [Burkholderiales bacterium RIFCSPHIGHO2_12_FULL_65_48]|nr:MAG: hypothetical protein A3E23_12125 [Burkholderiales bacterium RIFCSPHIGHO2_12_FULL_65_48]